MIRAQWKASGRIAVGAFACLFLSAPGSAADSKSGKAPSGLMVHVPLDGSFVDARSLGAVRPEASGTPAFLPGMVGQAALPGAEQSVVGELHVTRLSRLMLRGHTPEQGTIMVWCRLTPAAGDSAAITVIGSDDPLALSVAVVSDPPTVRASFMDRAGALHAISAPLPATADSMAGTAAANVAASWVHVALGWDSEAGTVTAFAAGRPIAQLAGPAYEMPGLPQQFDLGNPRAAIDDFRLYDRLLAPEELATLPGLAGR
jgi:hypothetical protein